MMLFSLQAVRLIYILTRYHWSLIVVPLRASAQLWTLVRVVTESCAILRFNFGPYNQGLLLVRIMVGKVLDGYHVAEIMRNTPVRQGRPGWNSAT
jgi:hypothetical protein